MDSIRKSLRNKIFLPLLGIALVLVLVDTFGGTYLPETFQPYRSAGLLAVFFALVFTAFAINLFRPLELVFREMRALLTGRPYKKIFTSRIDEVGILAHFFNDVTKNIERMAGDIAEGKRMSQELTVGSDIQRRILPKAMPDIPGLRLYGSMRPASEVGGDSFDIVTTASGNDYIYIGDVTGHGLPAALIMIMVNTLVRTLSEIHASGYDIIVNTNRILKSRIEPRRFMTCVLLRWNRQEQKLLYTGAGHEHILIFHKREGVCEVRQTGGIALGMVPDITKIVKEESIPLETGDMVVLYSDGIIEAKNMNGEMFGVTRLKEAVERYGSVSTPEELFTNISRDFGAFVGNQIQEDDITLIALKRQ